jgi:hypothetical protein
MTHIAKDDKIHMKNLELIERLHDEIKNKVKVLSKEVHENPGLKPILENYIHHVKNRTDEARALQQYFHFLLESLYKIDEQSSLPASASASSLNHYPSKKLSSEALRQLNIDQKAILFELNKWNDVVNASK